MCKVFEVSRSEYYAWRNWQGKENKNQWLVNLIAKCQKHSLQTYGCRRVRRWIQRYKGRNVNLKAVLRIRSTLINTPPQAVYAVLENSSPISQLTAACF